MEHSRQDAIDIMNAFHACCVLERDLVIALSSLNFYRSSTCKFLGEDNSVTLCSLHNLAVLYHSFGDYCKSLELCKKVYTLFNKNLGEEHPDTLTSLTSLALAYQQAPLSLPPYQVHHNIQKLLQGFLYTSQSEH